MSDFEIVNSSFDSDNSDDLNHGYAAKYIEYDEDKRVSQQTYIRDNSTIHVWTKGSW